MEFRNWLEGILGNTFQDLIANLKGKIIVLFDTETTGLSPTTHNQITQIAAVAVDVDSGKQLDVFERKVHLNWQTLSQMRQEPKKWEKGMPWGIRQTLKFNHYKRGEATHSEIETLEDFEQWLDQFTNAILVVYNAGFDMKFINTIRDRNNLHPIRNQVLDAFKFIKYYLEPPLLILSKSDAEAAQVLSYLWDETKNRTSLKLTNVGQALDVPTAGAHDALHDVQQLVGVFNTACKFISERQSEFSGKESEFAKARQDWEIFKSKN